MLYPESLIKRDFENKRKANKKRIEKSMSEWKEYLAVCYFRKG